jgi:hypothetical protein
MSARTWWIWATRCRLGHNWVRSHGALQQCLQCYKVRTRYFTRKEQDQSRKDLREFFQVHGRPHDQRMKDDHEGFDQ